MIALFFSVALADDPQVHEKVALAGDSEDATAVVAVVEALPRHPNFPNAPEFRAQVTPGSPHYDLEELYAAGSHGKGLAIARARLAETPNDPVLVWMIVRFQFMAMEEVDRTDTSVDKVAVYQELVDLTDAALETHPADPHLLFARGVARGRLGTTRGVLASLFMAKDVEADWVAAANSGYAYSSIMGAERLPCDVDLGLAIFYRLVPDWWIVKALAGTRGDLAKSVAHGEKALACGPNTIRHLKELGVSKICMGYKTGDEALVEAGRGHIRAYQTLPPYTNTEHIDIVHAQKILDMSPKSACEYSRDGQQDLDRKNLEAE